MFGETKTEEQTYILAVLLGAWAQKSPKTALAIYVTNRKKHHDPILKLLRDKLSTEEVWINAGDSQVQDKENHHMAGVGASSHIALAMALNASGNWRPRLTTTWEELQRQGVGLWHCK